MKGEKIQAARHADLYSYLLTAHPDEFTIEGGSLRPTFNHSISIAPGYHGFVDFSPNAEHRSGNSIDFLMWYMNYSLPRAVNALLDELYIAPIKHMERPYKPIFPPKIDYPRRVTKYLNSRGISQQTINYLLGHELIYEDINHNAIFINSTGDWGEIRGTLSVPYHCIITGARHDGYWSLSVGEIRRAYICEASIDAISLYELTRRQGVYISIGGVGKQPAIERIKRDFDEVVLAVDNDKAGEECRKINADLKAMIPKKKDWNDDLCVNNEQKKV